MKGRTGKGVEEGSQGALSESCAVQKKRKEELRPEAWIGEPSQRRETSGGATIKQKEGLAWLLLEGPPCAVHKAPEGHNEPHLQSITESPAVDGL